LLVSHDLGYIEQSCERVIWLDKGKIRFIGNASEAVNRYLNPAGSSVV
jgi:ABC-2 type transport system ATP-binding protein